MRGTLLAAVATTALTAGSGGMAHAFQTNDAALGAAEAAVTVEAGIATYSAAFFDTYSPVTALDMVRQIPGFNLSNGDQNRRGLGDSFGNLLIGGTRPSNKSLSLETVLQRIPASDVVRVELIREPLPQYDMRGHARLANVILREGAGNSGSWLTRLSLSDSNRLGPRGEISYTRVTGPLEYTLGLDGGWSGNRVRRRGSLYENGGTDLTELRFDNDQRQYSEINPTLSFNWDINERSNLRFDGSAEWWTWHRNQRVETFGPAGDLIRYEPNQTENHGEIFTGTTTYSIDLTPQWNSETILLATRESWDDGPEAFEEYDPNSGFVGATIVEFEGEYEETAIRQTFSWQPNNTHSFEFGAETALNARDTTLMLFEDDGVTITELDLPVASTRVEEVRSELFTNYVWSAGPRMSVEAGLRYEFSEITQTGDAEQERTFTYAKPNLTLNWQHNENNRIRLTGRRDVDQLSFNKFASSVDVADNSAVLGNPNYVPERSWTLEAEYERRLGEGRSASLVIGHDWVQDLDDFIVIEDNGDFFDAPGNIGDGTNLRATLNVTSPLDEIGLDNAIIDVFLEWYNTDVDDPLTGESRAWSNVREWELRLDYRQTFPELQLAWGWDYFWLSEGEVYRATEFRRNGFTDGDLDVYIETTRWANMTLRLGGDGIINNGNDRERVFFDGSRADGIIDAIEHRNASMGSTWYIQARGTF